MTGTLRSRPLPAVLHDRYRLGDVLGRGGASTVLRARDELLGRDVAVKVFTARATQPGDLRAQEVEARMLAALNHPGLVTLLDAGIDLTDPAEPQVFLILELVEQSDLRTRLRSGPLAPFDVAHLGFDLSGAIGYVHDHGIIHRDVKPANVLLAGLGTERVRGKLADFGIAMLRAASTRPEEQTTGTAAYLSPEQVEGEPLTPASDVYSLGLVLLEALTGRPAYTGTIVEAAFARLEREAEIPDTVPEELAVILRSMTARRQQDRPTPAEAEGAFRRYVVQALARPEPPSIERERLLAVRRYDLLDAPPEGTFDRITALAARLLGMPMAFVGLADEDRIRVVSRIGNEIADLPLPADGGPRSTRVLAATTVLQEDRVPAGLSAHGLRCLVATPLTTSDGVDLGVLVVADTVSHTVPDDHLAAIEDLAALVVHEMELRLAVRRAVTVRTAPSAG